MVVVAAGKMMRLCVAEVCEALMDNEERLNELDRGSGDGDCGSTMKAGCTGETQPHCMWIQNFLQNLFFFAVGESSYQEKTVIH